jgi:putative heme-binding domain-containing protein
VSCTEEYPFPAPNTRPGRDSIRILEDTKGAGRADKMTIFADQLNIPLGLYPYKNGVIAYSIPNIYFLEDTDGDGKADKRQVLYGPFDHLHDTHGMNNSFRRGFDGWIYANHGYSNHSKVRAPDGSQVDMQSGNTYRFRPDGSHIEQFTWGQVNPFGSTFDPTGDFFTADCHTKPIMLLLRNGYYDSFGKPHNGLGYVPEVMNHEHGSTAIAGNAQYIGNNWPETFRGNMFVGNVMTSRVNRDALRYNGSSVRAIEQPDFVISDDPWFRPVDIQMGPDGAMYIADFYNKIIGHYEVPLNHPGRDRDRGRIWRVTYSDPTGSQPKLDPVVNLHTADTAGLISALASSSLGTAMRAIDELTDRVGPNAIAQLRQAIDDRPEPGVRAYGAWALQRLGALPPASLVKLTHDKDRLVRIHAYRIAAETKAWIDDIDKELVRAAAEDDPLARRAAVDALGRHPRPAHIPALTTDFERAPADDVFLRHAVKLALLETIKPGGLLARWQDSPRGEAESKLLAEVVLALPTEEAGAYALDYLHSHKPEKDLAKKLVTHAARHLPARVDVARLVQLARAQLAGEVDLQSELLLAVRAGFQERGEKDPPAVRDWGSTLARQLARSVDPAAFAWQSIAVDGRPAAPWRTETRKSSDNVSAPFLSSLPSGERFTGILRSPEFVLPPRLSFYLCGHLGPPRAAARELSRVRLRLVEKDEVVAEVLPPRSDVAVPVSWDLQAHAGKRGYLEVVDGLNLPNYAWLAVGRFNPPVLATPERSDQECAQRLRSAAQLASAFALADLEPELRAAAAAPNLELLARQAAARAVLAFKPDATGAALIEIVADPTIEPEFRFEILANVASTKEWDRAQFVARVARTLPRRLQGLLASKLAENKAGAEILLSAVGRGDISPEVLRVSTVKDKLLATRVDSVVREVDRLTRQLPTQAGEIDKLLESRRVGFRRIQPSSARGREVFVKSCQNCHQIAGQGSVIGPQLDGIGERGVERIIEDVLDPNRNVDPSFRTSVFIMKDGRVLSGLFRRQEGKRIVIADATGKELSFDESQVEEKQTSTNSLMPSDVGTTMPEQDFYDLLSFLISQRTRRK